MSGSVVRSMVLAAAGALVTLAACSREHGTVAPSFERMLVQPRYEPYGASSFFPDGRAMRLPPGGTVSRERLADSTFIPDGAPTASSIDSVPLPRSDALLAVGQSRYGIYCAVCHGMLGDGSSVVARNMVACPPPSLLATAVRSLPAATVFQVITAGFGRMPAYAAQLPPEQRWAVIAYVRELQNRAPPGSGSAAPSGPGCGSRQ
jgi:mono/diheme cytochrome c family protein